jgi:acetyl/propionyl-CoA carboxylase alpha subunit
MSTQGTVGKWEFTWKKVPRGPQGTALVEVRERSAVGVAGKIAPAREVAVRWRRDADGIWLELPGGVHGFDVQGEQGDEGRTVYQLAERGGDAYWQGLSYLHAGEEQAAAGASGVKKDLRVRAQMPGKILRVSVKVGDRVEKGQSLLVMEAMKMENEIRATQSGKVTAVKVAEGQAVETGADLCLIGAD